MVSDEKTLKIALIVKLNKVINVKKHVKSLFKSKCKDIAYKEAKDALPIEEVSFL